MTAAFIDRTSNVFGALKPDVRLRLEAVIANPTQQSWDGAYSIILNGKSHMTLWQSWIAVDPDAVRSKPLDSDWPRVPDQLTIYRALKHATDRQAK